MNFVNVRKLPVKCVADMETYNKAIKLAEQYLHHGGVDLYFSVTA
jgi:hypothetical protein